MSLLSTDELLELLGTTFWCFLSMHKILNSVHMYIIHYLPIYGYDDDNEEVKNDDDEDDDHHNCCNESDRC